MKFAFILLSFALCNVHAASNTQHDDEPLLGVRNQQNVFQANNLVNLQYLPNINVMASINNTCPALFIDVNRKRLNSAAWETWIIEHAQLGVSEYSAAVR